ncbi:MAG: DUF1295 domain-containing protein [Spirochaetes bacterium]|nr:DUF1295 domain-containing protein [Spirochaetota bacterium]
MRLFLLLLSAATVAAAALTAISGGTPLSCIASADPLITVLALFGGLTLACFAAGWISGDYSWVDRLWSVVPVIYAWIYAARAWPDTRLVVMAALVTAWGARLTLNFARKGGYSGTEDYRWAVVRARIPGRLAWQAFNLGFISLYQNLLFVLFTLPLYAAWRDAGTPISPMDFAAAALFAIFLLGETAADQQQWNFQRAKQSAGGAKTGDIARGFITTGLFRYSRHPNFFCEQCIWWSLYLFAVSVTGEWVHPSGVGALLLTLLFQGSTALTERISMGKYPDYREYRKRTSRLFPWFSRPMP